MLARLASWVAVAFVLAALSVAGQVPPLPIPSTGPAQVHVSAAASQLTVSLDDPGTVAITVSNDAAPSGTAADQPRTVTLDVRGAPDGWVATVQPTSFQLGPGQSGKATLEVAVSGDARAAAATLNVTARLYPAGAGGIPGAGPLVDPESRSSAQVVATRQDSMARTLTERVGPYLLALLATALALLLALVVLLMARRRTAVRVACDEPEQDVRAGGRTRFLLRVANTTSHQDSVLLRAQVPEGWTAVFDKPEFDMQPKSVVEVGLTVATPAGTATGETFEVGAIASTASPRKSAGIRLAARVLAVGSRAARRRAA